MDVERHVVTVDGAAVQLPLKEFELLELLLRNAGRVLTRGQLIDRVWGADYVGDTKTLDVHVKRLRSKIEPEPSDAALHRHRARPGLQVRAVACWRTLRSRGGSAGGARGARAAPGSLGRAGRWRSAAASVVAGCGGDQAALGSRAGAQLGQLVVRLLADQRGQLRARTTGTSARGRRARPATTCTTSRRSWPPAPQPRRSNSASVD